MPMKVLEIVEGEHAGTLVPLDEFLEVNEGFKEDYPELSALEIGDEFTDGGGAAPVWTVRRVA